MTTRQPQTSASQFLLDLLMPERRDLGNDLVDILRQYNDNMIQYSATVNSLVALIASRTPRSHGLGAQATLGLGGQATYGLGGQSTPGLGAQATPGSLSGLGAQATQGLSGMSPLAELLRPRAVLFTDEQVEAIQRDTETFEYQEQDQEQNGNSVCPITHEPFQVGETLMRIVQCGHTFKRSALMEWLGRRMSCPVCRGGI